MLTLIWWRGVPCGNNCQISERITSHKTLPGCYWVTLIAFSIVRKKQEDTHSPSIVDFQTFVQSNHLTSLPSIGSPYTWFNNRSGRTSILERLDRGLVNPTWFTMFPHNVSHHLTKSASNHNPQLLMEPSARRRLHSFRYENTWHFYRTFSTTVAHLEPPFL